MPLLGLGIRHIRGHLIKNPLKLVSVSWISQKSWFPSLGSHFDPKHINLGCLHFLLCCHVRYTPHKIKNIDLERGEKMIGGLVGNTFSNPVQNLGSVKVMSYSILVKQCQALSFWVHVFPLRQTTWIGKLLKVYMCCSYCHCDLKRREAFCGWNTTEVQRGSGTLNTKSCEINICLFWSFPPLLMSGMQMPYSWKGRVLGDEGANFILS